jgi:hypothetical protein
MNRQTLFSDAWDGEDEEAGTDPELLARAATPASSLVSRSRSSNRSALPIIARVEEAARAASSLTRLPKCPSGRARRSQ